MLRRIVWLWSICFVSAAYANDFAMMRPERDGVEQLMVLSDRWVVVVVDPYADLVKEMDVLTGGEYSRSIEDVRNAQRRGHQTDVWVHSEKLEKMRWKHWVSARKASSEFAMRGSNFYTVTSDSEAYTGGANPSRVTTTLISVDHGVAPGYDWVRYGIYAYLELPTAMESGQRYTIALGDGKSVSYEYDLNTTVVRSIKINQIGYQPGKSTNYAYVGGYLQAFGALPLEALEAFDVVDVATGREVYSGSLADGRIALRDDSSQMDPKNGEDITDRPLMTGERVFSLDLRGLVTEGTYFIRIPGVGRSWAFQVGEAVYGEAFYTAMRGLYHQRGSFALEEPFTKWTRPRHHTEPVYESEMIPYWADSTKVRRDKDDKEILWPRFDIVGATTDLSKSTSDVVGGRYDAADYDRNLYHYSVVFDLLKLYEVSPEKFTDGQLNIPESGNGIPDLLDEVEFGIRVWKRSQRADGGVAGILETRTHPSIEDTENKWSFSQRTRWSSLVYAAAAAEYARAVQPFNGSLSAEYAASSLKAYAFGLESSNDLDGAQIHAAEKRGEGSAYTLTFEQPLRYNNKFLLMARVQLYLLTKDVEYLKGLQMLYESTPKPYVWPYTDRDFSPWLVFDLAYHPDLTAHVHAEIQAQVRSDLVGAAENYERLTEAMPYRMSWPRSQDYWMSWGASDLTNRARVLLIGDLLKPDTGLRKAAESNVAYMFGANPMGMSWTTGIGAVYPVAIQHESSTEDGVLDPYPGITIYGNTSSHAFRALRSRVWTYPTATDWKGKPQFDSREAADFATFYELPADYPVFRRWAAHPSLNVEQNEFTIHETNSSTIFSLGILMETGWMPSEALKARGPRDAEDLFGYWYLP